MIKNTQTTARSPQLDRVQCEPYAFQKSEKYVDYSHA